MPVKWLLHWQPSSGSLLGGQTLVDVMKCIESINAVKAGRWQVTASHHRPILRDQGMPVDCTRELLGITLSDAPSKYFFVVREKRMVVEVDSTMQDVMEKLQMYANRLSLVFEGFQYQLGDFQLKAGRAVLSYETIRGIVLEVEYLPACSVEQGRAVLQDFVSSLAEVVAESSSLLGQFVHLEPAYAEYGLGKKRYMKSHKKHTMRPAHINHYSAKPKSFKVNAQSAHKAPLSKGQVVGVGFRDQ